MRIYNAALGKFLSVDPITAEYPELTPYQFASNTPIQAIDLDGLEGKNANGLEGPYTSDAKPKLAQPTVENSNANKTNSNQSSIYAGIFYESGSSSSAQSTSNSPNVPTYGMSYNWKNLAAGTIGAGSDVLLEATGGGVSKFITNRTAYIFTKAPYEKIGVAVPTSWIVRTPIANLTVKSSVVRATGFGLKGIGYGIGGYKAFKIGEQYSRNEISGYEMAKEQTSNIISTTTGYYGIAWSIGWETGRYYTQHSQSYQNFKWNYFQPAWQNCLSINRYGLTKLGFIDDFSEYHTGLSQSQRLDFIHKYETIGQNKSK